MPRISVVVPIYNVEEFLGPCLKSVAGQSVDDLEVVMVDDGSTDGSSAIAEDYARRDRRFRLIAQANGGLSRARNTGADYARGEYLAFLDSDDVLPRNAYELLLGALEKTGSDFATGNVHRLTASGTAQAPFLAATFTENRLKTHVTRFRPLIADRTAWNKLWRRSFWDRHGFRFPEGRLNEDIPVTVPAHFLAASVDVIADPVYFWRIRDGGDLSITQRRLERRALLDRMTAVEEVSDKLARLGPRGAQRWYDESVVADDLRYYLNVLESADDEYRDLFLDRVNAFLDRARGRLYDRLPAIDRLKYQLVRRRAMPELLEVLRFEREDLSSTPPLRIRGRWYGDYPFRTDRRLRIPRSVYRLEGELSLRVHLEDMRRDGDRLRLRGRAYIAGIGAATKGAQRVEVAALRPGRLKRIRLVTSAVRSRAKAIHRPDATASSRQALSDLSWSGFEATLDPRDLRSARRWNEGTWEIYVTVRVGGVKRRRSRFVLDGPFPIRAVALPVAADVDVTAAVTPDGDVTLDVRRQSATLRGGGHLDGDVLELAGELRLPPADKPKLELRRAVDGRRFRYPLEMTGGAAAQRFVSRVRLAQLRAAEPELEDVEPGGSTAWELWTVEGGRRTPVALPEPAPGMAWRAGGREVQLARGGRGATLALRASGPRVSAARWRDGGALELEGDLPEGADASELLLVHASSGEQHAFAVAAGPDGRFTATLTPARIPSLAGALPLAEGTWELRARGAGQAGAVPVVLAEAFDEEAPLTTVSGHKPFALEATHDRQAVVSVRRDLADDEQGHYHQQRLRRTVYAPGREAPLRDAVVYTSFLGRQFSDSPRAIHEELVRRDAPLEHLWVVRDGRCEVPDSATVLREGSREYHEALGRARFVVTNDHFPSWFSRRPDQVCLQTWHGTPLKRLGLDVSEMRRTVRRFERRWEQQVANWQYVLSPNRFSTPILRRAYAVEGEMLETGYPRVDVLARPDRDVLGRELRRRLGISGDARVVLYAPTYRDQVVDRRGRYRLDLRLDLERLREAVGRDTVILFRKHHYIVDAVPETADGFVQDVSAYPDGTELLLAADVLVTDYSSMMFDFANTGRPMLFYTYDLDAYQDEIRGFYFDFQASAPGPMLRTTDELAGALRDLDGVRAEYAQRYEAFASAFCELDDGRAAARVVDRLFTP